jgi:hypothetical protein
VSRLSCLSCCREGNGTEGKASQRRGGGAEAERIVPSGSRDWRKENRIKGSAARQRLSELQQQRTQRRAASSVPAHWQAERGGAARREEKEQEVSNGARKTATPLAATKALL